MDGPVISGDRSTQESTGRKAGFLRIAMAICLLGLVFLALMTVAESVLTTAKSAGGSAYPDYVEYWAAGQLLVHGGNPYDPVETLRMERSAGWLVQIPEVSFSPPPICILVALLGVVGSKIGAVLWTVLLMVSLVGSVHLLWIANGRKPGGRQHLLGYCFAPALTCLIVGQIGIFLLLGISLFLYLQKNRPFLSGLALVVCFVKPHLFFPFGAALALWAIREKRFRVLAGLVVGLAGVCVLATLLDPDVWVQYAVMVATVRPTEPPVPNFSRLLRQSVSGNMVWLQFVPSIAAAVWALSYFWRRRRTWDWLTHGTLLFMVSEIFAPYAWFTDEAVVLPAMLCSLYRAEDDNRWVLLYGLANGIALAELFRGRWMTGPYFLWTSLAWLALCFFAGWIRSRKHQAPN